MNTLTIEKVYRGLVLFASGILPSGIPAIEGESYGVRFISPAGVNPSVAVTLEDIISSDRELGSISTDYNAVFTISARSRMQREALKQIVYSGLMFNSIPIYSAYDGSGLPASGATIINYAEVVDHVLLRDMPDYSSDRERFFWTAVVFSRLAVLGQ